MQKQVSFTRQRGPRGFLGRTLCRSFVATGLAAGLLALPVTTMHAPVAEAAPNAAGPECPGELSYGTRSEYVRYMQHLVNTYMSNPKRGKWTPIEEDGVFGIDTHRGVSIVQQYWNNEHKESIPVDGIVGPKTWKALGAC